MSGSEDVRHELESMSPSELMDYCGLGGGAISVSPEEIRELFTPKGMERAFGKGCGWDDPALSSELSRAADLVIEHVLEESDDRGQLREA